MINCRISGEGERKLKVLALWPLFCFQISVRLEASEDYEANSNTLSTNGSDVLQAGEQKTYVWTIIPKTTLGKQQSFMTHIVSTYVFLRLSEET